MKFLTRGLIVVAFMIAPGCCTTRDQETSVSTDSYKAALTKIRSNIAEIRSDVLAVTYDPTIKGADVQLIDATMALCDDTLAGRNAGVAPAAPATAGH